jgi:hypothetical protein
MVTKYTPLMTFILRLIVIFIALMAWTYSQAQPPDDGLTASTHFIVIIRDTSCMQRHTKTIYSTLAHIALPGVQSAHHADVTADEPGTFGQYLQGCQRGPSKGGL